MAIERIAIIGLGLIGGSLGLALKKAQGEDVEIIGYARRQEVAEEALRIKAVDRTESQMSMAVSRVDTVIIATPVMAMQNILQEISPHLALGTIVSDVGSTKAQVEKWAEDCLPSTSTFVGGHPMTGKESFGIGAADADLFADSIYCVTPPLNSSEDACNRIEEIALSIGAKPIRIEAYKHDRLVAGISHLPLILSSTLVSTLSGNPSWPEMAQLASTGFLDMTRLASGDPELYRSICLTNRKSIVEWIDQYIETLNQFRGLVKGGDQQLKELFTKAQDDRQNWLHNEGHRFNK